MLQCKGFLGQGVIPLDPSSGTVSLPSTLWRVSDPLHRDVATHRPGVRRVSYSASDAESDNMIRVFYDGGGHLVIMDLSRTFVSGYFGLIFHGVTFDVVVEATLGNQPTFSTFSVQNSNS